METLEQHGIAVPLGMNKGVVLALGRTGAKCPVGSMAHHAHHGVCEVVGATGLVRTLEVIRYVSFESSGLDVETLYDEIIESDLIDVHVSELDPCTGVDKPSSVASVLMLR